MVLGIELVIPKFKTLVGIIICGSILTFIAALTFSVSVPTASPVFTVLFFASCGCFMHTSFKNFAFVFVTGLFFGLILEWLRILIFAN